MMKTEFEDDNELNEILSECNDIENSDSMEDIQTDSIKKNEKSIIII